MGHRARLYLGGIEIGWPDESYEILIPLFRDYVDHFISSEDFVRCVPTAQTGYENYYALCDTSSKIKDKLNLMGIDWDYIMDSVECCMDRTNWNSHIQNLNFTELVDFFAPMLSRIGTALQENERTLISSFEINADKRIALRFFVEFAPPNSNVILDLTSFGDDYVFSSEDSSNEEEWQAVMNYLFNFGYDIEWLNDKVVVLGEGKTDVEFLRRSMNLLYPHLSPYFYFMDFDGSRAPGGAGQLVNLIKAFIGAGIKNKIIAIFDNDTAAESDLKNLESLTIPEHIKIAQYPDLEFAKAYPAKGPEGDTIADINGRACAIEMYLGDELLKGQDGDYIPIQWTGYVSRIDKYQGEILQKSQIQNRFRDKLDTCENETEKIKEYDWTGLRLVLNVIFEQHAICTDHDLEVTLH